MNVEREILRLPQPPAMSQPLLDALTALCFYERPAAPIDLLFVFGSNILQTELGALISQLIEATQVRTVLITGGIARYNDLDVGSVAESEQILSTVWHRDQEDIRFILETKSMNTLENAAEAQKLYDLRSCSRIGFIAHSYATMRSYLTLRRINPEGEILGFPFTIPSEMNDYPVDRLNWFKTRKGQSLVWGEYLRFEKYGRRGDFPIEPVGDVLLTIQQLLSQQYK